MSPRRGNSDFIVAFFVALFPRDVVCNIAYSTLLSSTFLVELLYLFSGQIFNAFS